MERLNRSNPKNTKPPTSATSSAQKRPVTPMTRQPRPNSIVPIDQSASPDFAQGKKASESTNKKEQTSSKVNGFKNSVQPAPEISKDSTGSILSESSDSVFEQTRSSYSPESPKSSVNYKISETSVSEKKKQNDGQPNSKKPSPYATVDLFNQVPKLEEETKIEETDGREEPHYMVRL